MPTPRVSFRFTTLFNRVKVEHKVLAGFLIGFLFVGVCAWVTLRNTAAYLEGYDHLFQIEETITGSQALVTALMDAEAGQRNYLLDDSTAQLAAYRDALTRIDNDVALLDQTLSTDKILAGELPDLHRLKDQQLARLSAAIELHRTRSLNRALVENFIAGDSENTARLRALINRVLIVQTADKFTVKDILAQRAQRSLYSCVVLALIVLSLICFTYFLIYRQLTEKQLLTKRLTQEANHDPLTKLPNRVLLSDWLEYSMAQAQQIDAQLAVLYIDLDGFKPVNDRFGHRVGDTVLCEIARRFVNTARDSDLVARVGGDEFVILLPTIGTVEDAGILAGRLIEALHEPILPVLYDQIVGASIGIALYPADGRTADELLHQADQAMTKPNNLAAINIATRAPRSSAAPRGKRCCSTT
jgi:diguanylate cyclase (GGDEF)-like protein